MYNDCRALLDFALFERRQQPVVVRRQLIHVEVLQPGRSSHGSAWLSGVPERVKGRALSAGGVGA